MSVAGITQPSRTLAELTAGLLAVPADLTVTDVTADSRAVTPGALFLACRGRTHHGMRFAAEALSRGARAVLYETGDSAGEPPPPAPVGRIDGGVAHL